MATIEEGLVAHLMADSSVTDLISTRLYPLVVPQDASLPAVAYQRISGPREHAHDGPSGLARARVQFTALGSTYAEAKSVVTALQGSLDGRKRGLPGVRSNAINLLDERDVWLDVFEKPGIQVDFLVWYQE